MHLLEDVHPDHFNAMYQAYFSVSRPQQGNHWQAVDGKELRVSIDKALGAKRGENAVFMVDHQNGHSQVIGCYSGQKDSERTLVRDHFRQETDLARQAYTFDALHCYPGLLAQTNDMYGFYLGQVKGNQSVLAEDLAFQEQASVSMDCMQTVEKAHGRIEKRKASLYEVAIDCVEPRWRKANIKSMMVVEREVEQCKTSRKSYGKAYYISNITAHPGNGNELFNAIRKHWRVESNNYIRNATLGEDCIRTRKTGLIQNMAAFLNLVINQLQKHNQAANLNIVRENLAYDRRLLPSCFRTVSFYEQAL